MERTEDSVTREEEPVSFAEVLELRQKVVKLEKDYQGAIRIAGEAQARVVFLEKIIDKLLTASTLLTEAARESTVQVVEKDAAAAVEVEDDGSQSLNGLSMVPSFDLPIPIEPKKEQKEIKREDSKANEKEVSMKTKGESVDEIQEFPDDNQMYDELDPILGEDNNEVMSNIDEVNETEQDEIGEEDKSVETDIETEEVEDDEALVNSKNIPKKRKSSTKGYSKSKFSNQMRRGKINATELECPECEYRGRTAQSWAQHLRHSHSSSPKLAGLALRCKCGHVSFSENHGLRCGVYNVTIVSRTIPNPTTPQCILCKKYPTTIGGYAYHLHEYHNKSLKKNKIFLKCSCGFNVTSIGWKTLSEHLKKCDSRKFTVHKFDEK